MATSNSTAATITTAAEAAINAGQQTGCKPRLVLATVGGRQVWDLAAVEVERLRKEAEAERRAEADATRRRYAAIAIAEQEARDTMSRVKRGGGDENAVKTAILSLEGWTLEATTGAVGTPRGGIAHLRHEPSGATFDVFGVDKKSAQKDPTEPARVGRDGRPVGAFKPPADAQPAAKKDPAAPAPAEASATEEGEPKKPTRHERWLAAGGVRRGKRPAKVAKKGQK
jgi:hypothetical protein